MEWNLECAMRTRSGPGMEAGQRDGAEDSGLWGIWWLRSALRPWRIGMMGHLGAVGVVLGPLAL